MDCAGRFPSIIDVVAHVFNHFGHEVSADWIVLAALNPHAGRTEGSRQWADALKSLSMERKDQRRAKSELFALFKSIFNRTHSKVKLLQPVARFSLGLQRFVRNEGNFLGNTMPSVVIG